MTVEGARAASIDALRLLDEAPDLIGIIRDGLFWYSNFALRTSLGFDRDESLADIRVVDLLLPDDVPILQGRFERMILHGERLSAQVYRLRHRLSGAILLFETTSVPLELDGARCVYFISRDVTQRRRLDQQLMQSNRLAALGSLAAGVAHEINNPLSYVMLNLEWVARKLPDAAADLSRIGELSALLTEARNGMSRVAAIVRQLRDFSRINDEETQIIDLAVAVNSAIEVVAHETRHRATIRTRFDNPPPVCANAARVEQVLLNLLLTSLEAMDERSLSTNEIVVSAFGDGPDTAVIEVTDNGPGIPPDVLRKLRDPFSATKPVSMGTALGLSICHSIVNTLGGQIVAESELGHGARFRVTLPATRDGGPKSVAAPGSVPPNGRRGRLLVVDDEPLILRTLRELLQLHHDVQTTGSAADAYETILREPPFDVIFCDLMMPTMTGIELYEKLNEARPDAASRMVFMTGGAFTPRAADFLAAVPNRHVEKPFSIDVLERIVVERLADGG